MDAFCEKTLGLLQLEREAEEEESLEALKTCTHKELQDKGICILKLRGESSMSFYGRQSMVFRRYMDQPLPPHKLSHGDIVGVFDNERPINAGKPWAEGVVNKVHQESIEVIFEDDLPDEVEAKVVNICMVASDVTMKRYQNALNQLGKSGETPLTRVCFENQVPQFIPEERMDISFKSAVSERLNAPQQEAVRRALRSKDLFIIHGPPGTGKTTTCVSALLEFAARDQRVLVCAPSNAAVDNLLIRLVEAGYKNLVRLGHPARVNTALLPFTLDALVQRTDEAELCKDVRQELKTHFAKVNNKKTSKKEKFTARGEIKLLQKELRAREKKAKEEVFRKSQMVLTTCAGATNAKGQFDVVLIDECAQALEVACWIPLQMARKGILAGDHQQLAATVKSTEAIQKGLQRTLFQRMHDEFGDDVAHLLSIQYRMNDIIMGWSSAQFYESKLESAESVKNHDHHGLTPLLFLDTAGQDGYLEEETAQQVSKMNFGEARLLVHYAIMLRQDDPKSEICCITPYSRQVETIRNMFIEDKLSEALNLSRIPVNSVDSFQGQESDVVLISLVRSNEGQEIGFLSDTRRLNVAVTRAKKHCVIIGDSSTISSNETLGSLYEYAFEHGQVRFAEQYMQLDSTIGCKTALEEEVEQPVIQAKAKPKPKEKPVQVKMDEAEMEKRRENFRKRILDAIRDDSAFLDFPKGLNACERMLVHEVATSMNVISHESQGEGKKRFVRVKLKDSNADQPVAADLIRPPEESESAESPRPEPEARCDRPKPEARCDRPSPSSSSKALPEKIDEAKAQTSSNNALLASLAAERRQREDAKQQEAKNVDQEYINLKKEVKSRQKKNKKKKDEVCGAEPEDEFDALLEEFSQQDKICWFLDCKRSVTLIADSMRLCRFCKNQFCQEHVMAEVHGCGDAVRAHERSEFRRLQETQNNRQANSSFGSAEWKRKQALNKLQGRIQEKESSRTPKKPDKD